MSQTKTTQIKARLANKMRRLMRENRFNIAKIPNVDWNSIVEATIEMHLELNAYKAKRKEKAQIQEARRVRGYVPKKRTTKEEYLRNIEKHLVVSK